LKPTTLILSTKRLPKPHLRLAIGAAIVDGIKLDDVVEKLWREDPEEVRSLYHHIATNRIGGTWLSGYHRRKEQRKKRRLPTRRKIGITLNTIAKRTGVERATLVSLMEHHGLLELVQFGLDQRRRMVTKDAYNKNLGHNVNPQNRIGHLEGYGKAATFPVFYEDQLEGIMWMLDLDGIKDGVSKLDGKKAKLKWLLTEHAYLPDQEIATQAGYTRRAVLNARQNRQLRPVLKAAYVATQANHGPSITPV
jgi:hypothetical protein